MHPSFLFLRLRSTFKFMALQTMTNSKSNQEILKNPVRKAIGITASRNYFAWKSPFQIISTISYTHIEDTSPNVTCKRAAAGPSISPAAVCCTPGPLVLWCSAGRAQRSCRPLVAPCLCILLVCCSLLARSPAMKQSAVKPAINLSCKRTCVVVNVLSVTWPNVYYRKRHSRSADRNLSGCRLGDNRWTQAIPTCLPWI